MIQVAPSMMCADICHLEDDLRRLEQAGVDLLHFDLMDGHFVPNMPMGLAVLEQLRTRTTLPFDVHLMVDDNVFFIEKLLKIGVEYISIHAESAVHLDRTLALIRASGVKAGVALNPATPLTMLSYVTEQLDYVLLMTVNPGYAGQKMVPAALRKIADCRAFLQSQNCDVPIEVDGNVSFEMIPAMVAAGADILVAGTSSVFHSEDSILANVAQTRLRAAAGVSARQEIPR